MAESQCSALHTNLTSFLMGSSSLVFDFIRFLEGTTSSTVLGKAKVLGKQACLTRTCVGCRTQQAYANVRFAWRVVLRCDSPPERLHRVRDTSKLNHSPTTCSACVLHFWHDNVGLLAKALQPSSLPQLVGLHIEIGNNDKWRANRVCELPNLRHVDLIGCLCIVSCGKVCKYHCQCETLSNAKKSVSNPNVSTVEQDPRDLPRIWRISNVVRALPSFSHWFLLV